MAAATVSLKIRVMACRPVVVVAPSAPVPGRNGVPRETVPYTAADGADDK
ncbi:hypothetical protein [Methylobacterium sp. WL7]|jgi:hypothetical protein|nr:hypothetical protein [Methylobacterium sp. WL7]